MKQTATVARRSATPVAIVARGAKNIPAAPRGGIDAGVDDEPIVLKVRTQRIIDALRADFKPFIVAFGHFTEKRAQLAPRFMKAYDTWKEETQGTFVGFVRLLDPSVPADRDGYRAHRTYQAAENLRSLVQSDTEDERSTANDKDRPLGMSDAFVRLLAVIVALIPGNQVEKLWTLIGEELHWSPGKVTNLRASVEEVEPLVDAKAERGHLTVQ